MKRRLLWRRLRRGSHKDGGKPRERRGSGVVGDGR